MRQPETHWLRSLLSVHSTSPSVGGQKHWYTNKHAHTNSDTHTKISGSLCCIYYQGAGMKVKVSVKLELNLYGFVWVYVWDFLFAPTKWNLNLAYRLFGGYMSSVYISCLFTLACYLPSQKVLNFSPLLRFNTMSASHVGAAPVCILSCGSGGHQLHSLGYIFFNILLIRIRKYSYFICHVRVQDESHRGTTFFAVWTMILPCCHLWPL